jgi:hypothetical protein
MYFYQFLLRNSFLALTLHPLKAVLVKVNSFGLLLLALSVICFTPVAFGNPEITVEWDKTFAGGDLGSMYSEHYQYLSIAQTNDGGMVVAGTRKDMSWNPRNKGWVFKLDNSGIQKWEKFIGFGSHSNGFVTSITQINGGGFAVTGSGPYGNAGYSGWQIVKLSGDGQQVSPLSGIGTYAMAFSVAHSITQTTDGDFIWLQAHGYGGDIQGRLKEINRSISFAYFDYEGTLLQKSKSHRIDSVISTADGGCAMVGMLVNADNSVDIVVTKWKKDDEYKYSLEWQQSFGGEGNDRGYSIIQAADGDLVVAGYTHPQSVWIIKLNSQTGQLKWERAFDSREITVGSNPVAKSIIQTTDGGFAVTGWVIVGMSIGKASESDYDTLVLKLDGDGQLEWEKAIGYDTSVRKSLRQLQGFTPAPCLDIYEKGDVQVASGCISDHGYSLIQTTDGGLAIAGFTKKVGDWNATQNSVDIRVVKLSQVSPPCSYSFSTTGHAHGLQAENGSVKVNALPGCKWFANSSADWITVHSGVAGQSNGTVTYSVKANPNHDARSGTITIAGQTFNITQSTNQLPTTAFTVSPTQGEAPLTVTLNGSDSTDADGEIVKYEWSINEETMSGEIISTTLTTEGEYQITLTVEDNYGATNTSTQVFTVDKASVAVSTEKTYQEGLNDVITKCQNDPASCGITASCPHIDTHASFSPNDGTLTIPAVDVPDASGGITVYQAEMSLVPGEGLVFSVTDAEPIQPEIPVSLPPSQSETKACLEPFLDQTWKFEPTYTSTRNSVSIITFSRTTDVTVDSSKLEGIADTDASKWYLSCDGEDYSLSYSDSYPTFPDNEMSTSNDSISYTANFKYSNGATEVSGNYNGAFRSIIIHHGAMSLQGKMTGNLLE